MSTAVLPTLTGLTFPVIRTANWKARKPVAISGKETAISDWSFPRWQWEATWSVLKQGLSIWSTVQTDMSTLAGFYNSRNGGVDSFLYDDPNDDSVTDQSIGAGDSVTTTFQLVRTFGGFVEPIYAPHVVTNVKDNGSVVNPANYTVGTWGSATPGIVTFSSPPTSGHTLTATFTFYFPCRFVEDKCEFEQFDAGRYEVKKLAWISIK